MKKIKAMEPVTQFEKEFCEIVNQYSGLGYGNMKRMITGIWAKMLMESGGMNEKSALLGALDLDTWLDEENKPKNK